MSEEVIVLDELFPLQAGLDQEIADLHHVDYESTHDRRVLALLVELGEFANETRCFKYWSLKPASPKEVVLDEYADGLHFFLSLGIPLGVTTFSHRYKIREKDLSRAIVGVYKAVGALHEHYDPEHYGVAFGAYLNLLPLLGVEGSEAIAAYKKKLAVNYRRQETKY
jgi:dimeric dUTPase (all-alpha-NTP-PPase superfamily)